MLEVASAVSDALERADIAATLSGGGAVAAYTENLYQSKDLDFVTAAVAEQLGPVLASPGFVRKGTPRFSSFEHPETEWYVEFPAAPLAFGNMRAAADECTFITVGPRKLRIVSPTHCVLDRVAAALAWNDGQSMEQAILVACHQLVDWPLVEKWFTDEGESREVCDRFKAQVEGLRSRE